MLLPFYLSTLLALVLSEIFLTHSPWFSVPGKIQWCECCSCSSLCSSQIIEAWSHPFLHCTCQKQWRCFHPWPRSHTHRRWRGPHCRTPTDEHGPQTARNCSYIEQMCLFGSFHSTCKWTKRYPHVFFCFRNISFISHIKWLNMLHFHQIWMQDWSTCYQMWWYEDQWSNNSRLRGHPSLLSKVSHQYISLFKGSTWINA